MKANTKFNRLLALLLTLVMLLGLFPIATVLAATGESHPKAVNGLKAGKEMCIFWQADGVNSISQKHVEIEDNDSADVSAEEKWKDLKEAYPLGKAIDVGRVDGKNFPVLGLAYYDLTSGTLYLLGQIGCCSFEATTDCSDVLTVIVDGDATLQQGWCGIDHKGLGKMDIEFRNNATLNIPEPGKDMYGYPKAAALDITWTKVTSRSDHDPDVKQYGDLELRGTGKLNIVSPYVSEWSYSDMRYGIQARNITIKDNVSLNIVRQRGTSFSSGILCWSLNIDTTGTVNIDVSNPRDGDESVTAIRSVYLKTEAKNYGFNLVNAQSVTLKTQKNAWVLGNGKLRSGGATGIYNSICTNLESNGWTVTKDASDAVPYTVTITPQAMPTAAQLTVGTETVESTSTIPNVTVTGGEYVSLKASVTLPTWLSNMYTAGRVKLGDSRTMNIYKGNSLSSADLVTGSNMTGYAVITNATALPAISFETSNFKPVAGQTYTVYASFPIVTVNGGKQLGSASVIATIKAVEKPISNVLSGSILYTSGVRYGADVTTARTGAVNSIASDKLHYQWQVKSGDAWTDISGATAGKLDASKVNTVVGKDIRLKITADGYESVLYSPVKTVAKAAQTAIPVTPELNCYLSTAEGGGALVQLTNKKDDQEYLRSFDTPLTDAELAASNEWRDTINNSFAKGYTLYIYTRMKETDTHAAGTIYRYTTVSTAEEVQLKNLALAGYTNNTIYVKKGEPLTIDVVGTPANANKWNAVHFIEQDNTASHFTVKVDNGSTNFIPAGTGTGTFGNHNITITSNNVGRHTLIAFPANEYNPYATPFGTWNVVVYEPGNITNFDIIDPPTYADVTLAVGESYAPELTNPTLTTKPAEAMTGHTLKWFVMTPATSTGVPTYSDNNGYISVDENGKVKALAANGTVNDGYKVVALHVVDRSGRFVKSVASYKVTVNPTIAPALESISVHPGTLTLKKGESADLTAIKNPINAEGIVTWSSNTGACTVDNTGKVTAVGVGTTTITATCGTKTATCTVKVICAEHTYDDTWTKLDEANHYRVCITCGEGMEIAAHSYGEQYTTVDGNTHKRTCNANGCTAEQTASHNWVLDHVEDATFTAPGKTVYKCDDNCGVANKEEPIAQLVKIDVTNLTVAKPVKGAAAAEATTTDTAYYVAATEWIAADGTVLDITNGDKFQPGTIYTVKITLETAGDGVFSANSTYNQIAGKTATVTPALTGDDYTDTVVLTYTFDATAEASPTEYTITVTDGKATVGAGAPISKAAEGTTITLTADAAPTGKVFDKWVVESGSITLADASSATTTFTMPAGAVSVKATYKNAPVATYNLTTQVNGGNGTISASKTGLTAGSTETVIFTPDSGYEIDTVTVNGVTTPVLSNVLDVTMDTDKTVIVTYKAVEHSHSYGSEWKNTADNHWHECSCGDKTDTAAHSFKWVVDKEATATEKGSKHEECTVCGYKKAAVEIPATGTPTKPTDPTDPKDPTKPADSKSPQTGDNSMMSLWIALLFVSGGVLAGTTLYSRKRKSVK